MLSFLFLSFFKFKVCRWEFQSAHILLYSIAEHKMSRGVNENNQLKGKLEAQLNRLLDQLEDINKDKDSLEEEEYNELRNDTMEQVG